MSKHSSKYVTLIYDNNKVIIPQTSILRFELNPLVAKFEDKGLINIQLIPELVLDIDKDVIEKFELRAVSVNGENETFVTKTKVSKLGNTITIKE